MYHIFSEAQTTEQNGSQH